MEAGRQLGVDAVVDGRLQRSGSRLRLTVQLVPTAGGAPLWADHFDEEFTHLFAVEDTVAERVATALVAELSAEERQRLGRRQTESLEAYQAYCRGRFFWGRFSRPWVEKAMLSFHEATAHDPRYALPHAGLADAFLVAGFAGALPPREAWALAAESSRRGPGPRRPDPGAPRLRRVSSPPAGMGLERRGARAAARHRAGARLRRPPPVARPRPRPSRPPRTTRPARCGGPKSWTRSRWSSRPSSACTAPSAASTRPSSPRPGARSSSTRTSSSATGRWGAPSRTSAATTRRRPSTSVALDLAEGTAFMRPVLARSLALAGRVGEARALLAAEGPAETSPYQAATVHLALGETDRALELLAAAAEQRDPWIVLLAVDPMLRPLRGNRDYEALVKRVRASLRDGAGRVSPRGLRGPSRAPLDGVHAEGTTPPPPCDSSAPIRLALRKSRFIRAMNVDADPLGAGRLALAVVGAVAEALGVHLRDHRGGRGGSARAGPGAGAPRCDDLGRGEEHGRGVGAGRDAGAAADAGGGVHGEVGVVLRDRDGVAVGRAAGRHARRSRRPR